MSFEAPDPDMVSAALSSGVSASPDPVKPPSAKTPPEQKTTPATKSGETKPAGDPPAKQLRQELETRNSELEATRSELAELKKTLEAGDPRIVESQREVREAREALAEAKKQQEEYQRKLEMADPAVNAKLKELDSKFNADAGKFYGRVSEIPSAHVNALVAEYRKLPFGSPEYRQARLEFEQKVNLALGSEEGNEHRKLEATLDFIERQADFLKERYETEQHVQANSRKLILESDRTKYKSQKDRVSGLLAKAREVPEGMAATDPFHPKVAIKAFTDTLPDKGESLTKGVPEFVEMVFAGMSPRSDEDYAGMSPEAISESKRNESERHEKARDLAVDVTFNGLKALRLFPSLVKEIQRLTEKLNEGRESLPPDPTRPPGTTGGDDNAQLADFTAPDLDNINFGR